VTQRVARTRPPAQPEPGAAVVADMLGGQVATPADVGSVTAAQIKMLGASMHGMSRDEALRFASEVTGRDIQSRNDLSKGEASKVIDALNKTRPAQDETDDDFVVLA
jgi:hypothetical protein